MKHRTFSLINIIGFSLAMASCFLIVVHIRNELSYEKGFPKHADIYRVHAPEWAKSNPPLAGGMLEVCSGRPAELQDLKIRVNEYSRRGESANGHAVRFPLWTGFTTKAFRNLMFC